MERDISVNPILIRNVLPNLNKQHLNLHARPPKPANKRPARIPAQALEEGGAHEVAAVREARQLRPRADGALEEVVGGGREARGCEVLGRAQDRVQVDAEAVEAFG